MQHDVNSPAHMRKFDATSTITTSNTRSQGQRSLSGNLTLFFETVQTFSRPLNEDDHFRRQPPPHHDGCDDDEYRTVRTESLSRRILRPESAFDGTM